jgi:hypothetical protein
MLEKKIISIEEYNQMMVEFNKKRNIHQKLAIYSLK